MSDSCEETTVLGQQQPIRVRITDADSGQYSCSDWLKKWREQDVYVTFLEQHLNQLKSELADLRASEERHRTYLSDSQHQERMLIRRLAAKEQETQDYVCQLNELKVVVGVQRSTSTTSVSTSTVQSSVAAATSLSTSTAPSVAANMTLVDPAVNCLVQHLRAELQTTRSKLEDTQNELAAWKFTPDSNTGKRLMAKCRLLYQENEELGRVTASGRIAKLEGDLALQRSFSEEVRHSQNELDAFLADLDEDVEGMQSTILFLQRELRRHTKQQDDVHQTSSPTTATTLTTCANGVLEDCTTNTSCSRGSCCALNSEPDRTADKIDEVEGDGITSNNSTASGGGGGDGSSSGSKRGVKRPLDIDDDVATNSVDVLQQVGGVKEKVLLPLVVDVQTNGSESIGAGLNDSSSPTITASTVITNSVIASDLLVGDLKKQESN